MTEQVNWTWDLMDCSLPGSSVHGISQAKILEWVAISFCRGFSQPRDQTPVSCIAGRFFTDWASRKAPHLCCLMTILIEPPSLKGIPWDTYYLEAEIQPQRLKDCSLLRGLERARVMPAKPRMNAISHLWKSSQKVTLPKRDSCINKWAADEMMMVPKIPLGRLRFQCN